MRLVALLVQPYLTGTYITRLNRGSEGHSFGSPQVLRTNEPICKDQRYMQFNSSGKFMEGNPVMLTLG